jgi:hypothetical protein
MPAIPNASARPICYVVRQHDDTILTVLRLGPRIAKRGLKFGVPLTSFS